MLKKPLLTVAIIIENQRELLEPTLTSIYSLGNIDLELFLINNGASDNSEEIIRSIVEKFEHEQTYYFANAQPVNRGNCLNEVLVQCNSGLLWAPVTIGEINEQILFEALTQLGNSENVALLQNRELPHSNQQWLELISNNNWPEDGNFIWNLKNIPPRQRFFNSSLETFCDVELAARLKGGSFLTSDQQWYQPFEKHNIIKPHFHIKQEILFSRLRQIEAQEASLRKTLLEELQQLKQIDQTDTQERFNDPALHKAFEFKQAGNLNESLEIAEHILTQPNHPDYSTAKQLKVEILEKKRRFVQASELKHEKDSRAEETNTSVAQQSVDTTEKKITVIIPTTTYGKPALEHCLLSLSEHCDVSEVELIIIDNASLDDTHDYLDELKEKQFLNCRVITNKYNKGFAASVNQGLEITSTPYACILHNDIEFEEDVLKKLLRLMESTPEYAVLGPATDKTLNPDQSTDQVAPDAPEIISAEYLDSFCMMIRSDIDVVMDEAYELAFFEDIDFCFQVRQQGYKVGIAPHITVKHYFGTTTFSLDLDTESKTYWKNVSYFNEKWNIQLFSESDISSLSGLEQLLALDDLVNPLFPEPEVKKHFDELLTDELKTEILNTSYDDEILCKLVHLFMVMDEREILRRLEDRIEDITLPASLIYQLVYFYFNKNIYSRCIHYLDQLDPQNESLRSDLYRLAIHVENKELNEAIPMLRELMEHAPANPQLYKLAGDLHDLNGNPDEASSFHQLAKQINPFEFSEEKSDAFGFKI